MGNEKEPAPPKHLYTVGTRVHHAKLDDIGVIEAVDDNGEVLSFTLSSPCT